MLAQKDVDPKKTFTQKDVDPKKTFTQKDVHPKKTFTQKDVHPNFLVISVTLFMFGEGPLGDIHVW